MEKFDGMLSSIKCADDLMTLGFKDDATFAYAQKVWDWVNGADNHSFIMVAGAGDCGWNEHRQPFNISTITYDEAANVASLKAKAEDWKTIAHSYDLYVGSVPITDSELGSRDIDHDVSLNIARSFPFNIQHTSNGITSGLECSNKCGLTGKFNLQLHVSQKNFFPTGASLRLSPRGVAATAELTLSESGDLTKSFTFKKEVLSIPINSITLPGKIVNIGPNLDIILGLEIGALSGSASISGGATVSLQDSAIVEFDLLNPAKNKFSGWTPSLKPIPVTVDAKISGAIKVFVQPTLNLVAEALGTSLALLAVFRLADVAPRTWI